jgi:hypothetical protein
VEHEDSIAEIHLSDLETDPAEAINLADKEPAITTELKQLAEEWRAAIERRWSDEYAVRGEEVRTYRMV